MDPKSEWPDGQETEVLREPINLVTNIREVVMSPTTTIFKYNISINYFFDNQDPVLISNSTRTGVLLEQDKLRCRNVVEQVFKEVDWLMQDQDWIIYDSQGCLYSFRRLERMNCFHTLSKGFSDASNFKRVEFRLETPKIFSNVRLKDARRAVAQDGRPRNNTLFEALSTIIDEKICSGSFLDEAGVSYLRNSEPIGLSNLTIREGSLNAHAGIKTSLWIAKANRVMVSHDLKYDLFYPKNMPLVEVMKSFHGSSPDVDSESDVGKRISTALKGAFFVVDFERFHDPPGNVTVMEIEGFAEKEDMSLPLKYPNLMKIVTTGEDGDVMYLPPEMFLLHSTQKLTEGRMSDEHRNALNEWFNTTPKGRYERTETIFKTIFPESFLPEVSFSPSLKLVGDVIRKPMIKEPAWSDTPLTGLIEWNIAFMSGEEVEDLDDVLIKQFVEQDMVVNRPKIVWIRNEDLERIFRNAKRDHKQLLVLVINSHKFDMTKISWWEHKYTAPCVIISPSGARKLVNGEMNSERIGLKCMRRLNGTTPSVYSDVFCRDDQLVIGISIYKPSSEHSDYPLTIGFSFNGSVDHRVFKSSVLFADPSKFESGKPIADIVTIAAQAMLEQRNALPTEVLIYFYGISEDQYGLVIENFKKKIGDTFAPYCEGVMNYGDLILVVASSEHNEQFYATDDKNNIHYPEPGTVIDHTVVSPEFEEFYYFGPGDAKKPTKYTVLSNVHLLDLEKLETITNDLCYVGHEFLGDITVPAPLEMANKEARDGGWILERDGPVFTNGKVSISETNKKFKCGQF